MINNSETKISIKNHDVKFNNIETTKLSLQLDLKKMIETTKLSLQLDSKKMDEKLKESREKLMLTAYEHCISKEDKKDNFFRSFAVSKNKIKF